MKVATAPRSDATATASRTIADHNPGSGHPGVTTHAERGVSDEEATDQGEPGRDPHSWHGRGHAAAVRGLARGLEALGLVACGQEGCHMSVIGVAVWLCPAWGSR